MEIDFAPGIYSGAVVSVWNVNMLNRIANPPLIYC